MDNSQRLGSLAELKVATDATAKGWHVFLSVSGKSPYDLHLYKDGLSLRVQVKGCKKATGVSYIFRLESGHKKKLLDLTSCDVMAFYMEEDDLVHYTILSKTATRKRLRSSDACSLDVLEAQLRERNPDLT